MNTAIRGLACNGSVRIFAINSLDLIKEVTSQDNLSPVACAALGRSMSITALMGIMKKNDDQIYTTINGGGEIGGIHVHYMGHGQIRGYVDNPSVETYINSMNKLDVSKAVGVEGFLTVKYRLGLKQDYLSSVPLQSGEISEDYTYFFASSEQTPSVVSAGVLVDNHEVTSAGAIIVQLMPDALEDDIVYIESKLEEITNLSGKLLDNPDINDFVSKVFPDFDLLQETQISLYCTCSFEDMKAKISTLSVEDLKQIKEEDKGLEAICPWCNTKYFFDENILEDIIQMKEA